MPSLLRVLPGAARPGRLMSRLAPFRTVHQSAGKPAPDTSSAATATDRKAALPPLGRLPDGRRKLVFDNRGPNFQDFLRAATQTDPHNPGTDSALPTKSDAEAPYLMPTLPADPRQLGQGRRFFVEVYGCQMNVNDTEVLMSLLQEAGYERTLEVDDADIIFLMTCSIRDNAEKKIWNRLAHYKSLKARRSNDQPPLVGVLGCMAERLKDKLLEADRLVDVVCGPDAYRTLPHLLSLAHQSMMGVANVLLSADETYADVTPVRLHPNQVSVHLSVMRGCNNMCSFCIVPFTRGIERSRPIASIVREVEQLSAQGIKEVMLLGQNVNSYRDETEYHSYAAPTSAAPVEDGALSAAPTALSRGFKTIYKTKYGGLRFAELMGQVARVDPEMRVRFTSPHPKDFPDDLLHLIRDQPNVCRNLHLPLQSGSTAVLERMRRGYTREAYLALVDHVRALIPDVTLSTDVIAGFCGETEADHRDTVDLMASVGYDTAYMFGYSMRERTHAHRRFADDVPADVKARRLTEIIETFHTHARPRHQTLVGRSQLVLVDGYSAKHGCWQGRTDGNHKAFIQKIGTPESVATGAVPFEIKVGDYVEFVPTSVSSTALRGYAPAPTTLAGFTQRYGR
ncbi:hypothetical protein IWQ60_004821 [Tieghemiomyces parasiticus]|uniref:CDK5RAP1-like protein n=1 Tax=Tieghemiomyces parasiticus TaxID=78921 RepID=A0A9W8A7M6_9FUNG|nr:hypothetical protein IWQ60_004821 [Tieghemiomyces parasiticus]